MDTLNHISLLAGIEPEFQVIFDNIPSRSGMQMKPAELSNGISIVVLYNLSDD
jgi:hypothetical protein